MGRTCRQLVLHRSEKSEVVFLKWTGRVVCAWCSGKYKVEVVSILHVDKREKGLVHLSPTEELLHSSAFMRNSK